MHKKDNLENDSLKDVTPIKSITPVGEDMWNKMEEIRNNIEENQIGFTFDDEEVKEEKAPTKRLKLDRSAFTSIAILAITASVASITIFALGLVLK